MNTGKQINAMVVVLFLTLVAVGVYAVWDPFRASSAEEQQVEQAAERAAITFTLNCRLCHGDRGQGGQAGGRLAAAAVLDSDTLRGIDDSGVFTQAEFDMDFTHVVNTITCGRVGTAMPTWGASQGGTLNEEQIRQLATLITGGSSRFGIYKDGDFWELAQEHADETDLATTDHAAVAMPDGAFGADATELFVTNAGPFNLGQYIRIKVGETEERLRVLPHGLRVERDAGGTGAASHDVGAAVLDATGAPVLDADSNEQALTEGMDGTSTLLVVGTPAAFSAGDVIQVDAEQMRVVEEVTGLPTTGLVLAQEIGREPTHVLVSDDSGLSAGQIVRVNSELLEIRDITDEDTGAVLDSAVSAGDDTVSLSDPTFFAPDYVVRVGSERIRLIRPVETGQSLGVTIGRAQTSFTVSGTVGLEEGELIRMDGELMRVAEILEPARAEIERGVTPAGGDATTPAPHAAGTELIEFVPPAEGAADQQPELDPTGQSLSEGINTEATTIVLTSSTGVSAGSAYYLDDELVTVSDIIPARIRVERAVDGTELASHARRVSIYAGNLFDVERGADSTSAAAHAAGDSVSLAQLQVKREIDDSKLENHSKNAEIFLGNSLIVERGVLNTDAAEHQNGDLIYDFPAAPGGPPTTQRACGQSAAQFGTGPTEKPTPIPNSEGVDVTLSEFSVDPVPTSVAAGVVSFIVGNGGTLPHNFRVIQTELAADALPLAGDVVDEAQLNVVGSSDTVSPDGYQAVIAALEPGSYVLICNVPTHYGQGMHFAFEVTP